MFAQSCVYVRDMEAIVTVAVGRERVSVSVCECV